MGSQVEAGVLPGATAQVDQDWRVDQAGRVETTEDAPLLVKETLDTEVSAGDNQQADGLITRTVRSVMWKLATPLLTHQHTQTLASQSLHPRIQVHRIHSFT